MIGIDHTAVPSPEPATPILASDLLAIEEKQRRRFSSRGDRIRTGCVEIDDHMLRGGYERGIAVGISAKAGEGRLISFHLLSSILISHLPISPLSSDTFLQTTKTKATIIDTTGSFPISFLAKILKSRILDSKSKIRRQAVDTGNYAANEEGVDEETVDETVQTCLEMVAISRVFDIEGLWEVLGEVGRNSESDAADEEETRETGDEKGVEIIIIDNMTSLINELFTRKERSEAHILLTTLSRALYTLTRTRNILTILHNTTVSSTSKSYATTDPSLETRYPNPYVHKKPSKIPQPTSIFPSNPLKPALGLTFSQFPDLHLLMSALPKTREDAERLYAQDDAEEAFSGGTERREREVGYCYVVEVLKDETPALGSKAEKGDIHRKFGGRDQRWAAVEISADGLRLVDAFMAKGGGLVVEREKGRIQDVGSVAKKYGFGGRRV